MAVSNPYAVYKQNAVKSADPGELTMMLYSGAVRFIKQGISAIEDNSIEKANNAIIRAQDIFGYLMETLNPDYQISGNLAVLYDYIKRRLIEANVKKDMDVLKEVLGLAEELRDTWQQAMELSRQDERSKNAAK